ncbi:hypothetical protein [Polyangium sp. 15x6]|uniref:hypothetical protein n=1 Tax=Polyangium sp. 15x6 TaxID=3042687 RepID=UPI00249AE6CE|nr:hypothetical protein [Polyangium sp. 15x6]MDI3288915.1 hypothetical protein [Polyangium sp. 15x6]
MYKETWACDPSPGRHRIGEGPFRVRGVMYIGNFEYANKRTPGGLSAAYAAIDHPEVVAFLGRTIFLAASSYDLVPAVHFVRALAKLEGTPLDRFVRARARHAGEHNVMGLYRAQMRSSSVGDMAARLPRIFERYFDHCRAEMSLAAEGLVEGRFAGMPAPMLGFYLWCNEGFIEGALSGVGARDVRYSWSAPMPDGERDGTPLKAVTVRITWTV